MENLKFRIDTKHSGWDCDSVEKAKGILWQIKESAEGGKGSGIRVKINGTTHTIFTWLCGNNPDEYLKIIGKQN